MNGKYGSKCVILPPRLHQNQSQRAQNLKPAAIVLYANTSSPQNLHPRRKENWPLPTKDVHGWRWEAACALDGDHMESAITLWCLGGWFV